MALKSSQKEVVMSVAKSIVDYTTTHPKTSSSRAEQSPSPTAISTMSTLHHNIPSPQGWHRSIKILSFPPSFSNNHHRENYILERENAGENINLEDGTINIPDPSHLDQTKKPTSILTRWIGTSIFFISEGIDLQRRNQLMSLVNYREHIVHQIASSPYDPTLYIDLSNLDHKLGFCDIAAGNAYRALILIKAGLDINKYTYRTELGVSVRNNVIHQLRKIGKPPTRGFHELQNLYLNAFRELLHNLLGSAALWEGLVQGQEALRQFPQDKDLSGTIFNLKEAFKNSCRAIQRLYGKTGSVQDIQEAVLYSRRGRIYQKPYPWLTQRLYTRTSALVKEVNKTLDRSPCKIKRVKFGRQPSDIMSENEDVGSLGIFATRDIRKGELLMVDESFGTCVSDMPSSLLAHCDACHAALSRPYMHPDDIIKPGCCKMVAYCSVICHEGASNGYHRMLCGKDIEWLYQDDSGTYSNKSARDNSRPILLLRIMSIVLSHRQSEQAAGKTPTHPLLHPLIARMTANYTSHKWLRPDHCSSWLYSENVVAAHRILQLLGVDVFTEPDFAPEVIQTICWRLENNVSRCIINLSSPEDSENPISLAKYHLHDEQNEHLLCLNLQYLFFNHSCMPNVDWHGSNPSPWVGVSYLTGFNGKVLKPGCSAIWCIASEDVKEGDELKISYVGNPLGHDNNDRLAKRGMLNKWFDSGCGCTVCEHEDEIGIIHDEDSEGRSDDSHMTGSNDDAAIGSEETSVGST